MRQAASSASARLVQSKSPNREKRRPLYVSRQKLSSEKFAQTLAKYRDNGTHNLAFLIGGADGLGEEALSKADLCLSLGPMILPHGLTRIVLTEQIYRAATILAGHPYHRG
jgi:23S rRNA (pseudouridine1915-N3)-methyltransferase